MTLRFVTIEFVEVNLLTRCEGLRLAAAALAKIYRRCDFNTNMDPHH